MTETVNLALITDTPASFYVCDVARSSGWSALALAVGWLFGAAARDVNPRQLSELTTHPFLCNPEELGGVPDDTAKAVMQVNVGLEPRWKLPPHVQVFKPAGKATSFPPSTRRRWRETASRHPTCDHTERWLQSHAGGE